MTTPSDCTQNRDALKLVREGTSQDQRLAQALDPAYAPVDERTPAHRMVFASAYSAFLRYFDANNVDVDNWRRFFSTDVSVQLAVAAVQDVEFYRASVKAYFDFLKSLNNQSLEAELKDNLGFLFSTVGSLAQRLDILKEGLLRRDIGADHPLRGTLRNLIQSQLAPAFRRLIAYYQTGKTLSVVADVPDGTSAPSPELSILGRPVVTFLSVITAGLSKDWITDPAAADWNAYVSAIPAEPEVYGSGPSVFDNVNHIATHNLFTSVFDLFLKVYARLVSDAQRALDDTFHWDGHAPHYALFLAFLRLFEYARAEIKTLTSRHLDFYYRDILRLKERAAQPGSVHLLMELARQAQTHLFEAGALFKAGKDDQGIEAFFANDRDFVANQAKVAALQTVYRHKNTVNDTLPFEDGRLFASPVANSDDGLGAKLTSDDQSWHPFFNKVYVDGSLAEIRMPTAEVGFAIASHYLYMAEGKRTITVDFTTTSTFAGLPSDRRNDVACLLTSEKGWIEKSTAAFTSPAPGTLRLRVELSGADPAVTPYVAGTHGYTFDTDLPILLVKLRHQPSSDYIYPLLQDAVIQKIELKAEVEGLKTLAVSNDFGPVDTSKPFQPYGASPVAGNALTVGSKEVFQKTLSSASIDVTWLVAPVPYKTSPTVTIDFLSDGQWKPSNIAAIAVGSTSYPLSNNLGLPVVDAPNLTPDEFYATSSRHGFARLRLDDDFGQDTFQSDLIDALINKTARPSPVPVGPSMSSLVVSYTATQTIPLNSASADAFNGRGGRFYHLAPFGQAEQHPFLSGAAKVTLVPQFRTGDTGGESKSEGEFYIGLTSLQPPQTIALLLQVADGTANPLAVKPPSHLRWSYLRGNEWIAFADSAVEDQTGGLLNSGIVTLAVPADASGANTLLPAGMHWVRAAVGSQSDAVCRLILVASQALKATFTDRGNDPGFPAKVLPAGTISKLDQPDADVKTISQPFATFGGRGAEHKTAFYTRASERLRHKDRAIALWDYEHLVLEAFPQIYKARCLNHTQYEPSETGAGVYRELAPGHVTVVTIPNQQFRNLRDPLRPFTSLGLLSEIQTFLREHLSCFVKLHVRNPQFEEVYTDFRVRLYDGYDETFYINKLKEEITRFLSPWAFPGVADVRRSSPTFGGKVYKSVLVNFVEERPYVDYVTDFKLFHRFLATDASGLETEVVSPDLSQVEGSKAVSILVSVPAQKHLIQPIHPAEQEAPGEECPCEAR